MTNPLRISFSDLVALVILNQILTTGFEWYYLIYLLFWARTYILLRRFNHAVKLKAQELELTKKLKNEKSN